MDGIVGSLRLGWEALLFKEDAYEEMRITDNPVVKGLILIVIVGVVIALAGLIGDVLEWASTPDLNEIQDIVYYYITRMPWWEEVTKASPEFQDNFEQIWNFNWSIARTFSPTPGGAIANIIITPLALVVRWLIYGLLAYLFARWLGGTGQLSETLGVLALAVAPQALNLLALFPYVQMGNIVSVWGILCAYVGLKTAHKLSWSRAVWATLLPFILFFAVAVLAGCFGMAIFAAVVKGA
jgi:hypothetical protein